MKRLRNLAGVGIVGLAGIVGGCSDTPTTDSEFLYWDGFGLSALAGNNSNLSPRESFNTALVGNAMQGYAPMAQQRELANGQGKSEVNQQVIIQGSGYQPPVQSNNEGEEVSPEMIEIIREYFPPKVSAN